VNSLLNFLLRVVDFYTFLIFAYVVLSWLFHFKVLSFDNMFLVRLYDGLKKMTDPPLDYIRRYIPNLGGIDIAPVILILIIYLLKDLLIEYWPIN
jgi:YggT family protein|tara:strand:+ start:127 stop:411 length:285 start_codon:yes stop_codon:yes gene_type:complete